MEVGKGIFFLMLKKENLKNVKNGSQVDNKKLGTGQLLETGLRRLPQVLNFVGFCILIQKETG
jgi:hypothetical protein